MLLDWLVVFRFNTKVIPSQSVTHIFPGFLTTVLTQSFFQSQRRLFSHASAEVSCKNTPDEMLLEKEKMQHFSSMFSVLSINTSPNKPLFICVCRTSILKTLWEKEKLPITSHFFFPQNEFCPF